MATQSILQSESPRNEHVVLLPAEFLDGEALPSLVRIAGQAVYPPVIEGSTIIVDTGSNILELTPAEVAVLRVIINSIDALPAS